MPKYNTLNKDIKLVETSNGYWDIAFINGDLAEATGKNSLRTGLIIACLTSWNYLNRQGNPLYSEFGNRAYEELKKKKSNIVKYKIQQYFTEVLSRIRRVDKIDSLEVYDINGYPNDYFVKFTVIATNDEIVKGEFNISAESKPNNTHIDCEMYMPYASNIKPLEIDIFLRNEYGVGLPNEILYVYLKEDSSSEYKFHKVTVPTDKNGYVKFKYSPKEIKLGDGTIIESGNHDNCSICFEFRGNTTHNGCESETLNFKSEMLEYNLSFYSEGEVVEVNNDEVQVKVFLKSRKTSTNRHTPIPNELLLLKDDLGNTYKSFTNAQGEALFKVPLKKRRNLLSVSYGTEKTSITYIVLPQELAIDGFEDNYVINALDSFSATVTFTGADGKPVNHLKAQLIDMVSEEVFSNMETDEKGTLSFSLTFPTGTYNLAIRTVENVLYDSQCFETGLIVNKYVPNIELDVNSSMSVAYQTEVVYQYDNLVLTASIDGVPQSVGGEVQFSMVNTTNQQTTVLGVSRIEQRQSQLVVPLNIESGDYLIIATVISSDLLFESSSEAVEVRVIPHMFQLSYDVSVNDYTSTIGSYTVDFSFLFTDYAEPTPNKRVRLYSEDTGYDKAMYTGDDGIALFTDVPVDGTYIYESQIVDLNGTFRVTSEGEVE